MTQTLYILVVDQAWAKLYKAANPPETLTLVYHQALFGARPVSADEELARSLCRLLRADRQTGKYLQLVMIASGDMLSALHRQYDGDWRDVEPADIRQLPARYSEDDLAAYVRRVLGGGQPHAGGSCVCAARGSNNESG